jgi:hypothetical protein
MNRAIYLGITIQISVGSLVSSHFDYFLKYSCSFSVLEHRILLWKQSSEKKGVERNSAGYLQIVGKEDKNPGLTNFT